VRVFVNWRRRFASCGWRRSSWKSRSLLRQRVSVSAKFELVDAEKHTLDSNGEYKYAITGMCGWLGVSTSGYYEWRRPESATAQIELVYRYAWRTRDEAKNALFAYIDGWYNTRRIQKDLGYLGPAEYEDVWRATNIDQPEPATVGPEPTGAR
jgi:transposase InsO family protein